MATFGINSKLLADINTTSPGNSAIKEISWLDEQLSSPSAYDDPNDDWLTHFQRLEQLSVKSMPTTDFYNLKAKSDKMKIFNRTTADWITQHYQMSAWWDNALGNVNLSQDISSDQLRQRTAYAFSQLLVVSKSASPLQRRAEGLAYYYDILAKNAFGNYENLLQEVLRSPAMGVFLSSAFNKKASLAENTRPDENLAREFLQLFTIGPYELNLDGSVKVDEQGEIIPAYSQNDIMEMAKILTGWILYGSKPWNQAGAKVGSYVHLMKFHPDNHEYELDDYYTSDTDRGIITLFKGKPFETKVDLNATDVIRDGGGVLTASGLDAAINVVFKHPNVGPFVSRHLIKYFVTSNPTPAYIERIARVFNDDGYGVRGNLKAVIRAILLDQEAYNQSIELGGKVKEPILAFCQFLRATDVRPWPKTQSIRSLKDDNGTLVHPEYLKHAFLYAGAEGELNQAALRSFDVFNFYDPNFKPPDSMLMDNQIISPESEILNDTFFSNFQNMLMKIIRYYRNKRLVCADPRNLTGLENANRINFYQPNFIIDLAEPIGVLVKGLGRKSGELIDLKATDFEDETACINAVHSLLDWYEENLLFSDLSDDLRTAFVDLSLKGLTPQSWNKKDLSRDRVLDIVENTLLLLVLSPQFMVDAGVVPDVTPPKIKLLGDSSLTLPYGSSYVEPGYKASDNVYSGDLNSKVTISGDVNQWEPGTYKIMYSVVDAAGNITETTERSVTISEKPKPVDKVPPILKLTGEPTLQILLGSRYDEPGYSATDDQDGDITTRVNVKGEVNVTQAGNYQLIYTVSDDAGNVSDEMVRTIIVMEPFVEVDRVPPQLMLFGKSIINLYTGDAYLEPGYKATDDIDGNLTGSVVIEGEVNSAKSGNYEIYYSVKDEAGNSSGSFNRTIIVSELDRTPPKLELLGSEVVTMTEDGIYNEPGYRAMDNKDGNLTAEVLAEGELNSSLPGTYELFYSVRDNAGNISDLLKRKIIVEEKDRMAPQIVLFGPATIMISLGDDYMEPGFNATDNEDGDLTSSVQIASDLNTSAVGQYELIYSVQDSSGNPSANIKRTIIVEEKIAEKDETPPMLILLGDINITLFLEEPFVEPGFNATDNKDGNISSSVVIQGSVDSMKVGKYELSYSVTDKAGNGSEILVRTITITERPKPVDNVPPRIELVGGEVLQIIAGSIFTEPGYTATDDVDGNITSKVKIQGAVDSMTPGNYHLFYAVKDKIGNSSDIIKRTVIVTASISDNVPPQLVIFGKDTMNLMVGEVFVEPGFEAVDNIDGIITARVEVKGDFNSSRPGKYELFYSVEDKAGNQSATFKRTLLVSDEDKTPPNLSLLGSSVVVLDLGDRYLEPGYRAMDNKDGNLTAEVLVEGELNSSLPETYELFYSVRDNAGNISDLLKRKIIVVEKDRMAPQIVLFGPATIKIRLGDEYMEPGFNATDNQDGDLTSSVQIASDLNTSAVGQYELIYSVQDSTGNLSATIRRTIIVKEKIAEKDETPPKLILLGDINITLFLEEPFVEPGFNATDNKDGNISSSVDIHGSVDSMKVGKYELSYSVTDKAGNGSEILVRTITITERPKPVDNVPPRIELVGGEVLQIIAGSIFEEPGYTATDDVDGNITSKVKVNGRVNSLVKGAYVLNYGVIDKAGNASESLTRKVIVEDKTPADSPQYWWSSSEKIGYGFYENWLGQFMPFATGWIYHLELGWLYVGQSEEQGLWMWMPQEGWLWSEATIWPFIWSNKTTYWIRYMPGFQSDFFFDYSTKTYRAVEK